MANTHLPAALLLLGMLASPAAATESGSAAKPSPAAEQSAIAPPRPSLRKERLRHALAPEYAERLAQTDGKRSTADREDRAALAKFYEARRSAPVWVGPAGLTPAGQAAVAEIAKADDWGLEAAAFRLPQPSAPGAQLSPAERADAEIALSLAVLKYARHARGGRAEPTVAQPQPRSQAPAARAAAGDRGGVAGCEPRCLPARPAPAASAVRAAAPEISGAEARPAGGGSASRLRPSTAARQVRPQASRRDPDTAQAARQHGAVALDAGRPRRLLRLGQRSRVHACASSRTARSSTPSA